MGDMRAVVYTAPREFSLETVPRPVPGPGEVLLRSTITGVCGTDLHIHNGGFFSAYPLTPGHEIIGTVETEQGPRTFAPIAAKPGTPLRVGMPLRFRLLQRPDGRIGFAYAPMEAA